MIERIENNTAFCRCGCGTPFKLALPPVGDPIREINEIGAKYRQCEACETGAATEKARRSSEAAARKSFEERLALSDIPTNYRLEAPPVRHVAEWLWRHRERHVLLSGVTGTGKTTSACFVALHLLREGRRVRYCKLRRLLAEWRAARTSEKPLEDEKLLRRLGGLDLLIIDEVVNKARVTESGQELLWEAIDSAISGEWKCRLWLLGNFYTGSIEELFRDPDTVRRRLRENFAAAVCTATEINKIEV